MTKPDIAVDKSNNMMKIGDFLNIAKGYDEHSQKDRDYGRHNYAEYRYRAFHFRKMAREKMMED